MTKKEILKKLPSVDKLLENKEIKIFQNKIPRKLIVHTIRKILDSIRTDVLKGKLAEIDENKIVTEIKINLQKNNRRSLRKVINATGIILHTNLGRAVLSEGAQKAVRTVIEGYSNLEFNLETGKRGNRYSHVESIICKVTGAESALVVNNNAAAVMLVLNTLAEGKEVIVSRGQLVEIGGSFRVPDVMKASGAKLIEVGTTNKTYLTDYMNAITEDTALLLKVHTSNFRVVGFTHETTTEELVKLGREKDIPVYEDLGSGFLVNLEEWGITDEPTVKQSLNAGADVVTFSGDKLLGGPQAGIIAGRKELLDKMKRNPLTRALRVDKMTLTALEATLWEYLDEEKLISTNPTLNMLTLGREELFIKAQKLKEKLQRELGDELELKIEESSSKAGGGSLPTEELPTFVVTVVTKKYTAEELAARLRDVEVPVIARIIDDKIAFDPRTIKDGEFEILVNSLKEAIMS